MSHFFVFMTIVGASFFVTMNVYALKKKGRCVFNLIFCVTAVGVFPCFVTNDLYGTTCALLLFDTLSKTLVALHPAILE